MQMPTMATAAIVLKKSGIVSKEMQEQECQPSVHQ